jgi:DNA-binding GntR family transcriptional regulator
MAASRASVGQVSTLNTTVYTKLKAMIHRREVAPGSRLVQQTLANALGTSVMPVIEALRRLERDGLVVHVPHLGSFVREASIEDIRELYCVRRGLESEAARIFAEKATPEDRDRLFEIDRKMNDAARANDVHQCIEWDMKFHLHLCAATKVKRLREIVENGQIEQRVFSNAPELISGESAEHIIGIHDRIVAALGRSDPEGASDAIRQHLLDAERDYVTVARRLQQKAAEEQSRI